MTSVKLRKQDQSWDWNMNYSQMHIAIYAYFLWIQIEKFQGEFQCKSSWFIALSWHLQSIYSCDSSSRWDLVTNSTPKTFSNTFITILRLAMFCLYFRYVLCMLYALNASIKLQVGLNAEYARNNFDLVHIELKYLGYKSVKNN